MTTKRYQEILDHLLNTETERDSMKLLQAQAKKLARDVMNTSDILSKQTACPARTQEEIINVLGCEMIAAFNNEIVNLKVRLKAETH